MTEPKKKFYTLSELLDSKITEPPSLVPTLLYEQDNVIILGDAKIGKSLFSMQLALSLTAGEYFLDTLKVTKPCKVLYVQAEGKMFETYPRTKRMAKEVPYKRGNLLWGYLPLIPMDKPDSAKQFIQLLGDFRPDVIFFDPLYKLASTGSLVQDDVAIRIINSLDQIKYHYDATIIINHHEHRVKRKETGEIIDEGDNSIFGSFVWRAWPDSVLLLQKVRKQVGVLKLSCDTQRSASVVKELRLVLEQPDPLYFEILEDIGSTEHMLVKLIEKQHPIHWTKLVDITGLAKSTIHKALRRLRRAKKIKQLDEPGLYEV